MHRLNPLDTAFVSFETEGAPLHVAGILLLEPRPGGDDDATVAFAEVRAMVASRLHLVPLMRQRVLQVPLGISPPVRVDDPEFDLDQHLTRAALPSPGGRRELDRYIGRIMSRPMFMDRPLWEMIFLEGLEHGRYALLARFHHSMIDGVSGAHILASFFDLSDQPRDVGDPGEWDPAPLPTGWQMLSEAGSAWLQHPMAVMESASRTVTSLAKVFEHNRDLPPGRTRPTSVLKAPRTSINGTISAQRAYASVDLDFAAVRAVGRAFSVTVTDVVLGITAGAVRSLLEARGELVDQELVAMVPVSTREEVDAGRLGNQISTMLVSLATQIADPVERLVAIHESAEAAKEQDRVLGSQIASDLTRMVPPVVANLAIRAAQNTRVFDHVPPFGNVLVSSVPGPDLEVWCAGRKVVGTLPAGPIAATIGLNVTAFRYRQHLHIGLLSCQHLVPEPAAVADAMAEALEVLLQAVAERTVRHDVTVDVEVDEEIEDTVVRIAVSESITTEDAVATITELVEVERVRDAGGGDDGVAEQVG